MGRTINTLDFARIISDKKIKDTGLERGQMVVVMATKLVPAKASDPYLHRTLVVVAKVEGGVALIPREGDNDSKAYLIDPRNLELVSEDEQEALVKALR